MSLNGQKVIIMGGTSGIGLATARAAVAAGARVTITGRNAEKLNKALAEFTENVTGETVDATSLDALKSFYKRSGPFDHLVLALSGRGGMGPFAQLDLAALRRGFEGKFWAQVNALQAGVGNLRSGGSIVFITAGSARTSIPGTSGLAAINGALEAMVPPLALELKPTRVNAVSPGVVATPWWDVVPPDQRDAIFTQTAQSLPAGRVGQPEDVAQVILLLLQNGFMTGSIIECDGGARIK
jgi:NAD(P)-dependent dehydrogenase (short-subunit alcohol dehydrogenase family)